MIDHNGKANAITPDEIIGAYEIATIHNGIRAIFYVAGRIIMKISYHNTPRDTQKSANILIMDCDTNSL